MFREILTVILCSVIISLGIAVAPNLASTVGFCISIVIIFASMFIIELAFYLYDKERDKRLLKKLLKFANSAVEVSIKYIESTSKKLKFEISINFIDLIDIETDQVINSWRLPELSLLREQEEIFYDSSKDDLSHLILLYIRNMKKEEGVKNESL